LSSRRRSGSPQRPKTRRNSSRASAGVSSCHCCRGGKLEVEQGARGLVDGRQPTGEAAVAHPGLLDGVDLPDLVDAGGPIRGGRRRFPGPPGSLERGGAEGDLKRPGRGQVGQGDREFARQFDADQLGSPIGVEFLHLAGPRDDRVGTTGAAAALILWRHAVEAPVSEGPPDLPDRMVGDAEFECDAAKLLAVEVAANDLLSNLHG
jgi:hypothetical protein